MDGVFHLCKLLSFILSQSHNIVSQACAQKVFHYAFCMYTLSRVLQMFWWCKASTTNQVRVQSGRGTLPISLCMASMPAHVECKPWAGIFDSLTWAPAHFLALEMVPFFPDKKALHPCTLTVYIFYGSFFQTHYVESCAVTNINLIFIPPGHFLEARRLASKLAVLFVAQMLSAAWQRANWKPWNTFHDTNISWGFFHCLVLWVPVSFRM